MMRVVLRPLTILAMAAFAQAAEMPEPTEFYVVSESFSDYGPSFYHLVVDVKGDGPDSVIRYIRVAPSNLACSGVVIQSAEARVLGKSLAQLVGANNPCKVKPTALRAALQKYRRRNGVTETISFGIVAQCGGASVSLSLPQVESVNLPAMKRSEPAIAQLWELSSQITSQSFGSNDIFLDRSREDDLALQQVGDKLVPELISGRYDRGLAAAAKGNVGTWTNPTFRSLLADYRGPISATERKAVFVPKLLNATSYRFSRFVAPKYAPLAVQARIEGRGETSPERGLRNRRCSDCVGHFRSSAAHSSGYRSRGRVAL